MLKRRPSLTSAAASTAFSDVMLFSMPISSSGPHTPQASGRPVVSGRLNAA